MATYVLVHGAWHGGWCWQRVAPLLRQAGHTVFTPTLTGFGERSHLRRSPSITGRRWKPSPAKNSAEWDAAANATEYRIVRGTPLDLPNLLTTGQDGCTAVTEPQQATGSLSTVPPPGSFFWYLVVGASGNVAGPAGPARIGGSETARSVDPTGACASP